MSELVTTKRGIVWLLEGLLAILLAAWRGALAAINCTLFLLLFVVEVLFPIVFVFIVLGFLLILIGRT